MDIKNLLEKEHIVILEKDPPSNEDHDTKYEIMKFPPSICQKNAEIEILYTLEKNNKIQKLKELNKKLDQDLKYATQNLIKKMHEYNEIKDVCQEIFGKIANLKDKTISEVHQDYNINNSD